MSRVFQSFTRAALPFVPKVENGHVRCRGTEVTKSSTRDTKRSVAHRGCVMSFITPQQAFANYEDGGDVDIPDENSGSNHKIRLNSAGRKVIKDDMHDSRVRTCVRRTKRMCGRDHRNRFVYPNGWSTNTGRMSICKEEDCNWSMAKEQQYNTSPVSREPCVNLFISLLVMAVLSVLAGNLLPR